MKTGARQLRVCKGHNLTQTAQHGKIRPSNVLTSTKSDQFRLNPGKKICPPLPPVKFSEIANYAQSTNRRGLNRAGSHPIRAFSGLSGLGDIGGRGS